jgi:hypothetical protein
MARTSDLVKEAVMRLSRRNLTSLMIVCLLRPGALLFAQDHSPPSQSIPQSGGGESFGPGANFLVIPPTDFHPKASTVTYSINLDGYLYATNSGAGGFIAGVQLPAGASVVNICVSTDDEDPDDEVALQWRAHEAKDAGGGATVLLGTGFSGIGATPGFGSTCVNLSSPTLIRKYGDLDGDGKPGYIWYDLEIDLETNTPSLQWGPAVITWLRTVSPAPASATFGDVPTNFIYFRAIEALAASGITGGCGSGNFCPNQTVTRGEMAAFFARALGLHWPY